MANKQINARIITKHDTEANWSKAITFVPREGEIVIYEPDNFNTVSRFKVGDGITILKNLPFITDPYVLKEPGKGLSTNDFTDELKAKAESIPKDYVFLDNGIAVTDVQADLNPEEGQEPKLYFIYNTSENVGNRVTDIPVANLVASVVRSGDRNNLGTFKIIDQLVNVPMGALGYLEEEEEVATGYMIENVDSNGNSYQRFSGSIVTDKTKILIDQELGNIFWLSYEDEPVYNPDGTISGTVRNAIYNPILPNGYNTNIAESRKINQSVLAGKVVREDGSGNLVLASDLSPLCYVVTDTSSLIYNKSIQNNEYPVALKGRALVYCENRNSITNASLGKAVCASSSGNVRIMTDEEKINHPESIVGYICEIPTYLNYGRKEEIVIDNRIWIKI